MGHPNWQRLAELGQLPEYMKGELPVSFTEANDNSLRSRGLEPNKEPAVEMKEITDIINDEPVNKYEESLKLKTNNELKAILKEMGRDDEYARNSVLIERILAPEEEKKENVIEEKVADDDKEEEAKEFVDELLN